ncbi:MAG: ABC transporter permease, partial [Chloroflexota bacterium]
LMVAIAMAMAALGGAWWPLLITPKFMQTFGHFFPSAWAMDAFQDIIVRGASLSDVALHVSIMMAFALVFFILGIWRLKFE